MSVLRAACCVTSVVGVLVAVPNVARAQRTWTASAVVGRAEHRVDLGRVSTAVGGNGGAPPNEPAPGLASTVDRASGTVVGGAVELGATPWLELRAQVLGGPLDTSTPGLSRDLGEVAVSANVLAFPWLAFQAGAVSRGFGLPEGTQHWSALSTGAEARLNFSGGRMRGIVRASVLPAVSVTDLQRPDLAVSTAAGLEMQRGLFAGAVTYSLERYDFPATTDAGRRLEQLGMITAKLGVRF